MDLKTAIWLLYCLRLRSRSPHNAQHSTSYVAIRTQDGTIFIGVYYCIIGASVSEPPLVDSTDALSRNFHRLRLGEGVQRNFEVRTHTLTHSHTHNSLRGDSMVVQSVSVHSVTSAMYCPLATPRSSAVRVSSTTLVTPPTETV